jgi:hypothetical protein
MKEIIIPILTFLGGYYVKQLFDNRDLRRKILEPVFEEFEKNIIYLQTQWRDVQVKNINHGNTQEYCDTFNHGKDTLIKSRTNMIFACKKIQERKLIPLVEEAFGALMEALTGYSEFLELRDKASLEQRKELITTMNMANDKFDKTLPFAMGKVYDRYWKLISGVLVFETFIAGIKNYRK